MGGTNRLAGLALSAAVGLSGCGGDATGAAVLPRRAAVSAAPGASAATTEQVAAQAVASVKAYYAEINRAIGTGDTAALRAMSRSSCTCRDLAAAIDDIWAAGRTTVAEVFLTRAFTAHDVYPDVASVDVRYDARGYEWVDKAGRRIKRVAGSTGTTVEVEVVREGGRWLVSHVRVA